MVTNKEFITNIECRWMKYKEFITVIEFSEEDNLFYGVLLNDNGEMLSDLVTWESDDLDGCEKSFHEAVDYYLEFVKVVKNETYRR